MKRFWLSIMAALLVTAIVAPVYAWEFSMTGEFEYRMQYFSRTGTKDIFGQAELQDIPNAVISESGYRATLASGLVNTSPYYVGAPAAPNAASWIGFAGPNYYMTGWQATGAPSSNAGAPRARSIMTDNGATAGVAITRGGFSRWGSDAFISDQRLTMHPSFRVNNAIRVHGTYTIGGLRQKFAQRTYDAWGQFSPGTPPFERYYMHHSSDSAYNTAAIGSWEQIRATIQFPIGILSIGVKDFPFGNGAIYAQNARTDSLLFIAPYGPLRIMLGIWPGLGTVAANNMSFDTRPDANTKWAWRFGPALTYDCGPLSLGMLGIYGSSHRGPGDSATRHTVDGEPRAFLGEDTNFMSWIAFMKYTNGRFFLNADWWTTMTDNYRLKPSQLTVTAADGPQFAPRYHEGYLFWAEGGVLAGPAKISLMYASVSGPVLNNYGVLADPNFQATKTYGAAINYQALRPYSFLMFPTYGGGNNTFNPDGTGQMSDAFAFAGRIDYAVAANLNIFGSYIWAHRLEKAGTLAGQYFASSNAPQLLNTTANMQTQTQWAQEFKGVQVGPNGGNPYVDDGFIGWEAQGGVSWKLLEGLTMDFAYAYWNLGQWFDQAYRAFTYNPNGGQYGNGLMQGRDPIHSLRGSFTIDF